MGGFRILVADDHPIFRFGLCSLLRSQRKWEVSAARRVTGGMR